MNTRLLILTAGFGEGHNAAARALAATSELLHGPGAARVVDLYAETAPRSTAVARCLYLALINRTPLLWSLVYRWTHRSRLLPPALGCNRRVRRRLEELIHREQPAAICSTFPAYAYLLERMRRRRDSLPPHFNIVTDSISINSLWWRAGGAGWFLPNEESAEVLRRAGVDPRRLHVCGFPVPPVFRESAGRLRPPDLAAGAAPRVLCIVNSGTHAARDTARRLFAEADWEITCAVGRDTRLQAGLSRLAAGRARPAQVLGWTNEIPQLLMTHHAVVSKAGGATTQEAIAARCPMIVNQIVPGQEEGNFELLHRHGVGFYAPSPVAVVGELRRLLADRGRGWSAARATLTLLARPDAAREILERVLAPPAPSPRVHPARPMAALPT